MLFDRYIAVDWSAENKAKSGRDSIWIAEGWSKSSALLTSQNPRTRSAAMHSVRERCAAAIEAGARLLVGFDFAFGYPVGAAAALCGNASWHALWTFLASAVTDGDDNISDRFHAAGRLNSTLAPGAPRYWGHPWQHTYTDLGRKKPADNHLQVAEKRSVERRNRKAQPVWKLSGIGAVGSQSFLGIPRLDRLRKDEALEGKVSIWPFETEFSAALDAPIVIAEIFPSIIEPPVPQGEVRDRIQVESIVRLFRDADQLGELGKLLSAPSTLSVAELADAISEEGWIVGVGHEDLVARLWQLQL